MYEGARPSRPFNELIVRVVANGFIVSIRGDFPHKEIVVQSSSDDDEDSVEEIINIIRRLWEQKKTTQRLDVTNIST